MNEIRRYETRGTAAMACREFDHQEQAIIDYEIARRSYEARVRLAQRQAASRQTIARGDARKSISRNATAQRSMSLQEAVSRSYTPHQTLTGSLSNIWEQAANAVRNHPFWTQLKYGTTAGRESGKATYKQVFTSATVCMVLSTVMIFVGA